MALLEIRGRVDHYVHLEEGDGSVVNRKLDAILDMLRVSARREIKMSQEMDALKVEVTNTKAGIDSAIVLINGIAGQIVDAAGDKTASLALAAELKTKVAELATAVAAAGTQPAPPPA